MDKRQKTVTWSSPDACRRDVGALSGLDYLKALKAGDISRPPVADLVGYRIAALAAGQVRYALTPAEEHYNPFATVHGGIISTLLDTAMTAAVITTLPRGQTCSTAEIKVNFFRPVTAAAGTMTCEARVVHAGKRLATAEGKVKDRGGRLYAMGVCSCLIFTVT